MEIEKKNYTSFDDIKIFAGSIDDNTGEYIFPTLYHKDSKNNVRHWTIKIRLIKGIQKKYSIDWDLLQDDTINIKQKYLENNELPDGVITQMWVEAGVIDGKLTRYEPSYPSIKNEGRSNERNTLEQSLVEARTLYLKKIEQGFSLKMSNKVKDNKYFPMLVRNYNDEFANLVYPLYIQPKLDGARCVIYLNKNPNAHTCTYSDVIMYSRQKKEYNGFDDIKKLLLPILIEFYNEESIYLDGELYKHGENLQTISGAVRNPNRDNIEKYKNIQLWMFDIFYPSNLNMTFYDRCDTLNTIFLMIAKNNKIVKTPTHYIKNTLEQEKIYSEYIKKKYEGIIIRNSNSLYLTHATQNNMSIRSKFVLKRKMKYSNEYELIGFTEGKKGKDKGAILWILKTEDNNEFHATPKNMTYKERISMYSDCIKDNNFIEKYKGRMMTIEYEDLSKDGIPLRAKSVGFREHI
jgi:hypothetical protein